MKSITLILLSCSSLLLQAADIDVNRELTGNDIQTEEDSSLMPTYGNWCGANYPKDIEHAGKPIDKLDSICKEHDYCYLEKGYLSCECDSNLTHSISLGLEENQFSGKEKIYSHTIFTYFKNSPCSGDHRNKLAPTRAIQSVVKTTETITKKVIGKIPMIGNSMEDSPNVDH
jgi:hypothetical protein